MELIEQNGLKSADRVIQVSKAYAKHFLEYADKTTVIPNGIDTKMWKQKSKYTFEGNQFNFKVVYIGRFAKQKGVDLILNAEIPPNVNLYFVGGAKGGEPALLKQIQAMAASRPNVFYLGEKYGQEKVDILMGADAVLMPSRHEPFGIVGLEAMISNNILITTFDNGIADYCPPDVGLKCGIHEDSISWALHNYCRMPEDEKKRRIKN